MPIHVSESSHEVSLRHRIKSAAVAMVGVVCGLCMHRMPVVPTVGVCFTLIWFLLRSLRYDGATPSEVVWSSLWAGNTFTLAWLGRVVTPIQAVGVMLIASCTGALIGGVVMLVPMRRRASEHDDGTPAKVVPDSGDGIPPGPEHDVHDQLNTDERHDHRDSSQEVGVLGHEV